eukprot:COSAG01_NODE_421_length_17271_cov_524.391218_18_plen_381_part_00
MDSGQARRWEEELSADRADIAARRRRVSEEVVAAEASLQAAIDAAEYAQRAAAAQEAARLQTAQHAAATLAAVAAAEAARAARAEAAAAAEARAIEARAERARPVEAVVEAEAMVAAPTPPAAAEAQTVEGRGGDSSRTVSHRRRGGATYEGRPGPGLVLGRREQASRPPPLGVPRRRRQQQDVVPSQSMGGVTASSAPNHRPAVDTIDLDIPLVMATAVLDEDNATDEGEEEEEEFIQPQPEPPPALPRQPQSSLVARCLDLVHHCAFRCLPTPPNIHVRVRGYRLTRGLVRVLRSPLFTEKALRAPCPECRGVSPSQDASDRNRWWDTGRPWHLRARAGAGAAAAVAVAAASMGTAMGRGFSATQLIFIIANRCQHKH